jgi:hypothetical protein
MSGVGRSDLCHGLGEVEVAVGPVLAVRGEVLDGLGVLVLGGAVVGDGRDVVVPGWLVDVEPLDATGDDGAVEAAVVPPLDV